MSVQTLYPQPRGAAPELQLGISSVGEGVVGTLVGKSVGDSQYVI